VSLIIVHVIGAGRNIPLLISGVSLVVIAAVVLIGALRPLARLPGDRNSRKGLA
jgi:hypothetical protein